MGADQDQEQSAFQAAAVGLSLGSLRNQRSLRGGVLGGRSARDCGLVVAAPGVVFGAQPAGCGGRGFVAVHLGQRLWPCGLPVGGLLGSSRCRGLTMCSSRPRKCCFASTKPCRRGGLTRC